MLVFCFCDKVPEKNNFKGGKIHFDSDFSLWFLGLLIMGLWLCRWKGSMGQSCLLHGDWVEERQENEKEGRKGRDKICSPMSQPQRPPPSTKSTFHRVHHLSIIHLSIHEVRALWSNHFLKAPPLNTAALESKPSTQELWGTIQSQTVIVLKLCTFHSMQIKNKQIVCGKVSEKCEGLMCLLIWLIFWGESVGVSWSAAALFTENTSFWTLKHNTSWNVN